MQYILKKEEEVAIGAIKEQANELSRGTLHHLFPTSSYFISRFNSNEFDETASLRIESTISSFHHRSRYKSDIHRSRIDLSDETTRSIPQLRLFFNRNRRVQAVRALTAAGSIHLPAVPRGLAHLCVFRNCFHRLFVTGSIKTRGKRNGNRGGKG